MISLEVSSLEDRRVKKVPTPLLRWLSAILITCLIGTAVFYFTHSVLLVVVGSLAVFVALWALWLTQRSFKCKVCGGWLEFRDKFGFSHAYYLACHGCEKPWSMHIKK